ncbi:MAG: hypothetical protein WDA60_01700 [Acidimicrobiia bacterium]
MSVTTLSRPTSALARRTHTAPAWALSILVLCAFAYTGLFFDALSRADGELLQALTIAPILIALTVPLALRIARRDHDRTLASIILAGAALKLLMGYVQFRIAYGYYQGRTDAQQYDDVGRTLAPAFRKLDFATNIGSLVGTGSVKFFTGIVYAIFGTSRIAGFVVFGWIGFLGLLALARAFRIGVPQGDSRRYLIAVLFLPSLLYWPATIGKEAPMLLGIGLAAYGSACLFQRRTGGLVALAGGLFIVLTVRPHVALIMFVGLVFAVLVRKAPARNFAAPVFRLLGVAALVALGLFIMSRASSYLETNLKSTSTPATDTNSIGEQLDLTQLRTTDTEAGSSFSPVAVRTPLDIPPAFVTVMFRPFPFEVSNAAGLLSSAEGLLLIGLLVISHKRLRSIPRMIRTTPYVAFSIGYLVAFTIAFSRFANFGILSRQRVQAIPFLLVLIALPKFQELVAAPAPELEAVPQPAAPASTGPRRRSRRPPVVPRARTPVSSGSSFLPPVRTTR